MVKPVRKSLPKQIADMIEEKIKNNDYKIGDKLPPEPTLIEMFGVSRNTVREAIQSLVHSGLLETRQGDGTYVVAKERLQVDIYNIMNATTEQNVMEVRDLLEKHIVVSAIENCTPADIRLIEELLVQRNRGNASIREATQADLDFHIAIAQATHNDIILSIYRYVSEYFNQFIYEKLYRSSEDEQSIDEIHNRLFRAIQGKDSQAALDCVNRLITL